MRDPAVFESNSIEENARNPSRRRTGLGLAACGLIVAGWLSQAQWAEPYGKSVWEIPGWNGGVPQAPQAPADGKPGQGPGRPPQKAAEASNSANGSATKPPRAPYRIPRPRFDGEPPALEGGDLLAGRAESPRVPVLAYTHVYNSGRIQDGTNVLPEVLEAQLAYLREEGYKSISLEELHAFVRGTAKADPGRRVLLAFDEGSPSSRTTVAALLERYDFTAVLFLSPMRLTDGGAEHLTRDDVRALLETGRFELGAYGLDRSALPRMDRRDISRHLRESRRRLERELGVQVVDLAYPYGLYDRRVIESAREVGYRMAFTVNSGTIRPGMDPFTLPRLMIVGDTSPEQFAGGLQVRTPARLALLPPDGSRVAAGQPFSLAMTGVESGSLNVRLRGIPLRLETRPGGFMSVFPAQLPGTYLPLTIRGRGADGRSFFKQVLYVRGDSPPEKGKPPVRR